MNKCKGNVPIIFNLTFSMERNIQSELVVCWCTASTAISINVFNVVLYILCFLNGFYLCAGSLPALRVEIKTLLCQDIQLTATESILYCFGSVDLCSFFLLDLRVGHKKFLCMKSLFPLPSPLSPIMPLVNIQDDLYREQNPCILSILYYSR